jgi:6-pyruvoyltetrahydropterin/6-carboxytetrahydropterin synthase
VLAPSRLAGIRVSEWNAAGGDGKLSAMPELARTVRFCITHAVDDAAAAPSDNHERAHRGGERPAAMHNTFAGWPSMVGLGAHYELEVACRGEPHPQTGYVVNISAIDDAVRRIAIPHIAQAASSNGSARAAELLAEILAALGQEFETPIASVRWRLTPYHSLFMTADAADRVLISQQFEFAAAHRLHCPALSDAENRAVFGRCNNPHGHGHNYRLEAVVAVPLAPADQPPAFTLAQLERIVHETVIARFDHANLNVEVAEFASLNPSVENIARVCHDLLAPPIERGGGRLVQVSVWETEKTRCTYAPSGAPVW